MLSRLFSPPDLLICLLCGALAACVPTESQSASSTDPSATMTPSPFSSVSYAVGNAAFHGRTTIELSAGGEANVTFEQGDSTQTYAKRLTDAELADFVGQLMALNPCELQPQRADGNPGEDQVEFRLQLSTGSCDLLFWKEERHQQAGLKQLVELFRTLQKLVGEGS